MLIKQRLELEQILEHGDEIIESLQRNKGGCDEIWLYLERKNGIEFLKQGLVIAKDFAEKVRTLGIKISVETTPLGHGGELLDKERKEFSVDSTGAVRIGQYCWRSESYRKAKAEKLSLIAGELKPYTFYFDDDLRIRNWSAPLACFCNSCIEKFNKQNDTQFTREDLAKKIETDISFRNKYLEFCYEGISEFCYVITKEIIKNSPETHMGVEHGEFSGECFVRCIEAMYKASGKTVRSRSGAGSYSDYYPTALSDKTFETQYQLTKLPSYVDERCNEIENYPATYYSKTIYGTCLEASLHFASGFNSTSIKCWRTSPNVGRGCQIEMFDDCLKEGAKRRTYWESLAKCNLAGGKKSGLQIFIPKNYLGSLNKDWMISPSFYGRSYNHYGIPLTFAQTKGNAYYLDEEFAKTISEEELQMLLRASVATSGAAIAVLEERGFGNYFSITAKQVSELSISEIFTDHNLNGAFRQFVWSAGLFAKKTYAITASDETTEVLSTLQFNRQAITVDDELEGKIASAIITTKLGGKWFVQGYRSDDDTYPWAKRQQINDVIRHITGGLLAEHISRNRLMLFPIENNDGVLMNVSILNPTIEHQKNIELIVRKVEGRKAYLMNEFGKKKAVKTLKTVDGVHVFINEIKAWSIQTLFFE